MGNVGSIGYPIQLQDPSRTLSCGDVHDYQSTSATTFSTSDEVDAKDVHLVCLAPADVPRAPDDPD